MSTLDMSAIKQALEEAGLEVYRARPEEIQVAERVRLHIMDSGVRVMLAAEASVRFIARSQLSDFPNAKPDQLVERVRAKVGPTAIDRGYQEDGVLLREITDPVDDTKILDVWHEVSYQKVTAGTDEVVAEVRWALELEKYVSE